MRVIFTGMFLAVIAGALACGSETAPPRDLATRDPPAAASGGIARPPDTTATSGGASVRMGTGTSCWSSPGGAAACIDMIGPITQAAPFALPAGARIDVAHPVPGSPISEARVTSTPARGQPQPVQGGSVAWPFPGGQGQLLASSVDAAGVHFSADLPPGRHVVSVFLRVPQGDVSYGVLVEVR